MNYSLRYLINIRREGKLEGFFQSEVSEVLSDCKGLGSRITLNNYFPFLIFENEKELLPVPVSNTSFVQFLKCTETNTQANTSLCTPLYSYAYILSIYGYMSLYRVLAQASCELVKPPETRPTEGQLFINVELSPMASPAFENGR